ncbi:MAG: prefoldin subunit alpha [Thaumarchaeota archaeon]|nr:prefoldin subunit alpha [Nitrososphaerota archaeon]
MSSQQSEEERVNSVVVEIRMLEGTYNELSVRQNLLERALIEGRSALEAIKTLSDSKPEEVLIPVGGGALVRSPPPDVSRVLVNVGANLVIEKTREEATAFLEERVKEIEKSIVAILSQRNQIAERLDLDRQALQSMITRPPQKN